MIRIDAMWIATEPMDMRAGTDTALARVVKVFGAAHPNHAYLFANRRATRMKVLVHDGIGIWLPEFDSLIPTFFRKRTSGAAFMRF